MKTLRGLNKDYNVTVLGNLIIGCKIETTTYKYGEYVRTFCGEVVDIIDGSISVKANLDGSIYNTVTSGTNRLEGATIEVL